MDNLRKNEIYTVEIDGYSSDAMGVCRINGRAVFVPNAMSGEKAEIRIVKVGAGAVYGRMEKLLVPSAERVAPACPYFGKCGGCDTWHMSYSEELRFKLERVNSALRHIGGQNFSAKEMIGSDRITRYRNKAIFSVSDVNGAPSFGFYKERSHELITTGTCLIQSELSCKIAAAVVEFMKIHNIPAYDEASGKGVVRHIFCRQSVSRQEAVACIVAARGFGALTENFAAYLRQTCPELTGIVLNINKTRGNTMLSGNFYMLWGNPNIRDSLCGTEFEIAPQAFFQINPPQAEKLYQKALEFASAGKGNDLVLDLYCGAGTISLCLASRFKKVIGTEVVPEAIENARKNAERNGILNAEFICADAGEAAQAMAAQALHPDAIVVDPPRKGMSEAAVSAVASMRPDRLVYVSCNPATLARDIKRFNSFGYSLINAVAVDMFPRTSHVETVCLMSRKDT